MKKTQVSTNVGILSILSGFLSVYQDVKIVDFMAVFANLTYGEVVTMAAPFLVGALAMFHNEESK